MNVIDWIKKQVGYRLGIPGRGNAFTEMSEMQVPPGWGYQSYLQAYGQIGWLFACVNVIASAVAKVPWHLYEVDPQGERTEVFIHPLVDLLNNVNPFYTRYQFMYLGTMYKLLVGEEFWQINFNQGGLPGEIWLAPPAYMSVVPSAQNYIDHYEYKRGAMAAPINFTNDEIIHIMTPNPYNPYRGLSPAQALTTDLDSERYAARYQQKLFFNDATPGFVVKYPAADMPPLETRKELMQEWDDRFKGFRNRGKTAFLWGGEPMKITMTNTDMDFNALRHFSRDVILGAYRVPGIVVGMSDANRANAEAGQYQFAMYAVDPELAALREALNKELVVFFGDNLYLDYDNPIPEDETRTVNNATNLFKSKLITRNEARQMTDFEALDTPEGEEFFTDPIPQNPFGAPGQSGNNPVKPEDQNPEAPAETGKAASDPKAFFKDEAAKEEFWKSYVKRVEAYEAPIIKSMTAIFEGQKQEALESMKRPVSPGADLINKQEFIKQYEAAVTPVLSALMSESIKQGMELVAPTNPHKESPIIPPVVNARSLEWLKQRIGWAAMEIGEGTAKLLGQALTDGFAAGESMEDIAKRVAAVFDVSPARAMTIARTETIAASNFGAVEGYKETGIVHKTEWYTAIDERVCPLCETLHGHVSSIGDGEVPPAHPLCRCVILPVIE